MSSSLDVRRTVTLVAGENPRIRAEVMHHLRHAAGGQPQPPSLWLQTGEPASAGSEQPDQQLPGGCICCLGGPAFRTTLVRLLRQPDWQHLWLETGAQQSHVFRIIDQLRSPPFEQHLQLVELIQAVPDDAAAQPARPVGPAGWASLLVSPAGHRKTRDPLADREGGYRQHWPADAGGRPPRQAVNEALQLLLAVPGVMGLHAVLQSSREAYDWRLAAAEPAAAGAAEASPRAAEIGSCTQDLNAVLRSQETGWRLDNRLWLELAQGVDRAALDGALHALQALWE